jgi:NifU-like protein involved in Fe-S cluster formation
MYSDEILKHFQNPQHIGAIEHPDGFGQATGGDQCPEDLAHFWIRVVDGQVAEVKQRTRGCPVAIAASSVTAVLAQGKTVHEARQITEEQVAQLLGDMPERKLDSIVGPRALQAALDDHLAKQAG